MACQSRVGDCPFGSIKWQYEMACQYGMSVWPNQNDYAKVASRLDCRNGVVNMVTLILQL